jgi:hypothetical protein
MARSSLSIPGFHVIGFDKPSVNGYNHIEVYGRQMFKNYGENYGLHEGHT